MSKFHSCEDDSYQLFRTIMRERHTKWKTKQGKEIKYKKMSADHLKSCVTMIVRNGLFTDAILHLCLERMREELKRRGFGPWLNERGL